MDNSRPDLLAHLPLLLAGCWYFGPPRLRYRLGRRWTFFGSFFELNWTEVERELCLSLNDGKDPSTVTLFLLLPPFLPHSCWFTLMRNSDKNNLRRFIFYIALSGTIFSRSESAYRELRTAKDQSQGQSGNLIKLIYYSINHELFYLLAGPNPKGCWFTIAGNF